MNVRKSYHKLKVESQDGNFQKFVYCLSYESGTSTQMEISRFQYKIGKLTEVVYRQSQWFIDRVYGQNMLQACGYCLYYDHELCFDLNCELFSQCNANQYQSTFSIRLNNRRKYARIIIRDIGQQKGY